MKLLKYLYNEFVVYRYIETGRVFGAMCSYSHLGKCGGFDEQQRRFEYWENKYAQLGYKKIELDSFIDYGGYGKDIRYLRKVKRKEE